MGFPGESCLSTLRSFSWAFLGNSCLLGDDTVIEMSLVPQLLRPILCLKEQSRGGKDITCYWSRNSTWKYLILSGKFWFLCLTALHLLMLTEKPLLLRTAKALHWTPRDVKVRNPMRQKGQAGEGREQGTNSTDDPLNMSMACADTTPIWTRALRMISSLHYRYWITFLWQEAEQQ